MWPFDLLRRRGAIAADAGARRVLLLWWGAFPEGGDTVGDYHSVRNLADALAARGLSCDVMSGAGLDFGPHRVVPFMGAGPAYAAAAFVCGPFVPRARIRKLLKPLARVPKAGLAISVIGPRRDTLAWFDAMIERDSDDTVNFDLSLAGAEPPPRPLDAAGRRLSICLRGRQKEYGKAANLSEVADAAIVGAASAVEPDFQRIDTVLSPSNPIELVERQIAGTSLLMTTRLHASLFALFYRVPFIALDQVKGSAKVTRLLRRTGWEHIHPADAFDAEQLRVLAEAVRAAGWTGAMEEARARAIALSREMLDDCTDCLVRLASAERG